MIISVAIPVLSILVLILIALLQRKTERLKIIESKLHHQKAEAYREVFDFFFEILKRQKLNPQKKANDDYQRLMNAKKTVMIYGSDKVFKAFSTWLSYASSNLTHDTVKTMRLTAELLIEIRKDIGNVDTKIGFDDIMLYLIQDIEEFKKLKAMQT